MSPALANFLFEAANFLVLAAALGWILFRPVRRALDRERERRSKEEADAREDRAEADRLVQEARRMREGLEHEMETRRAELLGEAQREAHQIREDSRNQQAAELQRVEAELESSRSDQVRELAGPLGRIAGASVRNLLEALDGPSLDRALVKAACRELGGLAEKRPATVETARPLDSEARRMLGEVLGEGFQERVVEDLGAGVRVATPSGQVDATATALARQAAEQLSDAALGEGAPIQSDER